MPDVELGVNDLTRMGLEVVGRHDILPCPTEQWIRYEDVQFHPIIDRKAFEKNDHIISFKPPDATYLELMRFRTRPPKARELPMQARCTFQTSGNKVNKIINIIHIIHNICNTYGLSSSSQTTSYRVTPQIKIQLSNQRSEKICQYYPLPSNYSFSFYVHTI